MYENLFKPTYLARLCQENGLTPSKQFGQNYLINRGVIDNIITAAKVNSNDVVVEVGPGFGALTLSLANHVNQVIAFEIEKKLQSYWIEKNKDYPNVTIIWGNVLSTLTNEIPGKTYKVVANLPYQITGKILVDLLTLEHPPSSMTVMVQKEVADRIVEKAGNMSVLSVIIQMIGTPKIAMVVSSGSFFPAPKVHSAVVHIADIKKWDRTDLQLIISLVKFGFQNKRKQLINNLVQAKYPKQKVESALASMALSPTVRAQELSVDNWVLLSKFLSE